MHKHQEGWISNARFDSRVFLPNISQLSTVGVLAERASGLFSETRANKVFGAFSQKFLKQVEKKLFQSRDDEIYFYSSNLRELAPILGHKVN